MAICPPGSDFVGVGARNRHRGDKHNEARPSTGNISSTRPDPPLEDLVSLHLDSLPPPSVSDTQTPPTPNNPTWYRMIPNNQHFSQQLVTGGPRTPPGTRQCLIQQTQHPAPTGTPLQGNKVDAKGCVSICRDGVTEFVGVGEPDADGSGCKPTPKSPGVECPAGSRIAFKDEATGERLPEGFAVGDNKVDANVGTGTGR